MTLTKEEIEIAQTANYYSRDYWGTTKGKLWPAAKIAKFRGIKFVDSAEDEKIEPYYFSEGQEILMELAALLGFGSIGAYTRALQARGKRIWQRLPKDF